MKWSQNKQCHSEPAGRRIPSQTRSFAPLRMTRTNLLQTPFFAAFFFILFVSLPLLATEELPPMPEGPLILTSIRPEQLNPDYWINRLPEPDRLILNAEALEQFNRDIYDLIKERFRVFEVGNVTPGKGIREQLKLEYQTVKGLPLFGVDDRPVPDGFFEEKIKPLVHWETVPEKITVRWGATVRAASVRSLPTDVKMFEEIGDIEFDQLQFTLIKLWTPVAILHKSSDGLWVYVQAPDSRGWVHARDIALFESSEKLRKYSRPKNDFLVVTGDHIPIFSDTALTQWSQKASMGTILPLVEKTESAYVIWLPVRGAGGKVVLRKAFIGPDADVSHGFLPYTQRQVIRQAFKLLGARYGWGGTYQGRDCSGFIQDVFLPFGIDMPRTSKEQIYVGTQINHFPRRRHAAGREEAIRAGTPGITLFRLPMHMMLYLGEENGQFYVIHSTWAERTSMTSDEKNRVNQVVVSDLTLNGNSYLGPLLERIIAVNEVD